MSRKAIFSSKSLIFGVALISAPALTLATPASEGSIEDPVSPVENVIQRVSTSTPQRSIGRLIEDVCPGSLTPGNAFDLDPSSDLKQRCDEMWVNSLLGGDISGVTTGLQGTANEEDAAIASLEVDSSSESVSKIQGRMATVRGGSAAGLAMNLNGTRANTTDSWTPAQGAGDGASQSPWGGFLAGIYSSADRDTTDRESGFDADIYGFTGGIDYRFSDNLLLGIAFNYSDSDSDISANGGNIDSETWGVYGYGTYYPANGWYLDYTVGYSETSHDQQRNISYTISEVGFSAGPAVRATSTTVNQAALSDTDSDEFTAAVTIGRDFQNDTVTFGPYIGFSYADIEIDGFTERMSNPTAAGSGLALFVNDQDFESIITKVGAAATFTFDGPWGPIWPYFMGEYLHEYKNSNDDITGGFVDDPNGLQFRMPTDAPDRNYFNLGAGFTASISDKSYFYTRYTGLVGFEDLTVHTVEFGFLLGF